eukprot:3146106-Rhodomonas_salina.1
MSGTQTASRASSLRVRYAMSGTDIVHSSSSLVTVHSASNLRSPYAMSGTDLAYGAGADISEEGEAGQAAGGGGEGEGEGEAMPAELGALLKPVFIDGCVSMPVSSFAIPVSSIAMPVSPFAMPVSSFAIFGTDCTYPLSRCPVLTYRIPSRRYRIPVRYRYAMPGTDIAYGARRCHSLCNVPVLREGDAMCGTETGYAHTRLVMPTGPEWAKGAIQLPVRDLRYWGNDGPSTDLA